MTLPTQLLVLLDENQGTITTAQAHAAGVSRERLRLLVQSGALERVRHGVYIQPDEFLDRMYILQQRRPKVVYSHETALYLHDLTDRDPTRYMVTVPRGYASPQLRKEGLRVFTVKKSLYRLGVTQMQTTFGHAVTTYNMERTICDCIRSRSQLDIATVTDAVRRYTRRTDKSLNLLMEMAAIFRVTKPLRSYLEVLL